MPDVGFDVAPLVADRTEPPRDEVVARIVDVIEVPYLKPIAPRLRRPRVSCPITRPTSIRAPIVSAATRPPRGRKPAATARVELDLEATAVTARVEAVAFEERPKHLGVAALVAAITACGYLLGRITSDGARVLVGSLAVGLALTVAFTLATAAMRAPVRPAGRTWLAAATGGLLVLVAALAVGALMPSRA